MGATFFTSSPCDTPWETFRVWGPAFGTVGETLTKPARFSGCESVATFSSGADTSCCSLAGGCDTGFWPSDFFTTIALGKLTVTSDSSSDDASVDAIADFFNFDGEESLTGELVELGAGAGIVASSEAVSGALAGSAGVIAGMAATCALWACGLGF